MELQKDMELPKAIESEQAVLGAIIAYQNSISKVVDLLKAEDFYNTNHVKIYREMISLYSEMISLYSEGLIVDISTLAQKLNNKGVLQEVGGASYY